MNWRIWKTGAALAALLAGFCAQAPFAFAAPDAPSKAVRIGEVAIFEMVQGTTRYITVEESADLANTRIKTLLADTVTGPDEIRLEERAGAFYIMAGTATIAILTPEMTGLDIEATRAQAGEITEKIRREFELLKKRDISVSLLTKFFVSFVYPLLMVALLVGLRLLYRALLHVIYRIEEGIKIGQFELISPHRLRISLKIALITGICAVILVTVYIFLAVTFYYFPVTRSYALSMYWFTKSVWSAFTHKLVLVAWRILAAAFIVGGALALVNTVDKLFDEIELGRVQPTSFIKIEHIDIFEYLAKAAIVLFAITLIILLLPGRGSNVGMVVLAFLGLSVSFGFVPVLKNAAAGFLIAFSKSHHKGAVLIIDQQEAAIMRTGVFFTSLRFASGEIHQLPNSQILKGRTRLTPNGDIITWAGCIRVAHDYPVSEIQESLEEWSAGWSGKAMVRISGIDNGHVRFEIKMPYLQSSSEVFLPAAFDGLRETMLEKKADLLSFALKS
ncbi:MAG: mechanosensitive ion channel [Elusimicrobiaceae bacterium]|nr:mechanosensitive ion channel [Elusimicrobiaceae bacterium]